MQSIDYIFDYVCQCQYITSWNLYALPYIEEITSTIFALVNYSNLGFSLHMEIQCIYIAMKIHQKFSEYEVHAYCQLIPAKITNNHKYKSSEVFSFAQLDTIPPKKSNS